MTAKESLKEIESVTNSLDKNILRARTLHDISRDILLSFDLDTTYKTALYSSIGTLGVTGGIFLIYDKDSDIFTVKCRIGTKQKKDSYNYKQYFKEEAEHVFQECTIEYDSPSQREDLKKFMRALRCSILMPIKIKNDLYGILGLGRRINNKPFNPTEIEFLDTLCSLISISIENSESQKELNYKIFELSTLYEISKEFSSNLDIKNIQTSIIFCCMGVVGAKRGAIFLYDNTNKEISLNHAINFSSALEEELKFKIDDELLARLLNKSEPFFLTDLRKNSKEYNLFNKLKKSLKVISDPLIIPQIIKRKLVGYLILAEKINKSAYTKSDINLLYALSYQSSLAIANAKSYQEVKNFAKKNAALYDELRHATEEKLKAERLATLGMVVSTITHDIKNPLTAIRYFSSLLGETDVDEKNKKEYLDIIDSEMDRLVGMIEELLSFAKGGEPLKIKECSVQDIFDEIFVVLERDFKNKKIQIFKDIKYSGKIHLDNEKIKRVLYNIAYNARDALKNGGKIKFKVNKSNGFLNISISDNGNGIPEKIADTIFMPFVTHGKAKGTGLGLAISKKIIEDHNGEIGFNSRKNRGTTFNIKLPLNIQKNNNF